MHMLAVALGRRARVRAFLGLGVPEEVRLADG
jgi:hypothetical protein